jgi:hypothetical protein
MVRFPTHSDFENAERFSTGDVLQGVRPTLDVPPDAGFLRVQVDGRPEDVRFYGREGGSNVAPLVYLSGDCLQKVDGILSVFNSYGEQSPLTVQNWAEQVSVFVGPHVLGSSPARHIWLLWRS